MSDTVVSLSDLAEEVESQMAEETVKIAGQHDHVPGDDIAVHFIEDGLTALGQVWYRGQVLRMAVGDAVWAKTLGHDGSSWLELSKQRQIEVYGKQFFDYGPWPFDWDADDVRKTLRDAGYPDAEVEAAVVSMKALEQPEAAV